MSPPEHTGEAQLGPGKELDILIRNATKQTARAERNAPLLQKLAKLASIALIEAADETPAALSALYEHLEILVPMAGIIDVEAETSRLNKDLQKHRSLNDYGKNLPIPTAAVPLRLLKTSG